MDEKEFKNRIAELAVIEDVKVASVNIRSKKQEEEMSDLFPPGENPTLGFELKAIRAQEKLCELGCGDMVANQRIEYKKHIYPIDHWRTRCVNCECTLSPDGKGFIEGVANVNNAYMRYFKNKRD